MRRLLRRFAADPPADGLHLAEYAQQVAAPQLLDLLLGVAAADELERDVEGLGRVAPAVDAAAAIEVGADADVVDADELDRVVDVVDEVLDGGLRWRGEVAVDAPHGGLIVGALLLRQGSHGAAAAAGDAEALAEYGDRLLALG